jgi:hypothetical protein
MLEEQEHYYPVSYSLVQRNSREEGSVCRGISGGVFWSEMDCNKKKLLKRLKHYERVRLEYRTLIRQKLNIVGKIHGL